MMGKSNERCEDKTHQVTQVKIEKYYKGNYQRYRESDYFTKCLEAIAALRKGNQTERTYWYKLDDVIEEYIFGFIYKKNNPQ